MESGGGGPQPSGRGRGRPRASYAQTGELDLSLIREYRSRPSLYDRNSRRFKDKMFTAQQWQMISHKLGYDVSLLKDRMLQLRNRYNIEKRRLEQTREENNDDNIDSPWPLFDTLSFLSDHIRSRRSYKHFDKKPPVSAGSGIEYENSDENYDMHDDETEHSNGAGGLMADVKVEMSTGSTDDEYEHNDPEQQLPVATVLKAANTNIPNGALTMVHAHCFDRRSGEAATAADEEKERAPASTCESSLNLLPPSITLRRVDNNNKYVATSSSHTAAAAQTLQQQQQQPTCSLNGYGHYSKTPTIASAITLPKQAAMCNGNSSQVLAQSQSTAPTISLDDDTDDVGSTGDYTMPPPTKRQRPSSDKYGDKYRAFGEFVSSSLLDLPPRKALRLVEKFTSELVQSLMQHADGVASDRHVSAACPTDEVPNGGCDGI